MKKSDILEDLLFCNNSNFSGILSGSDFYFNDKTQLMEILNKIFPLTEEETILGNKIIFYNENHVMDVSREVKYDEIFISDIKIKSEFKILFEVITYAIEFMSNSFKEKLKDHIKSNLDNFIEK